MQREYAMFIVIDPEPTEEDDAATPPIEGWFDFMLDNRATYRAFRLQPKDHATTIRVPGGNVLVTDGPFAETKAWIAGLAIIECEAREEAIEQTLEHNMAYHGRLELLPIHSIGGRRTTWRRRDGGFLSR